MSFVNQNPTDVWLERNLHKPDATRGSQLLSSPTNGIRLRVLPMVLVIAALIVAITWYHEASSNLLNAVDRVGYPALLAVTTLGALLLKVRPGSLNVVMTMVFVTYVTHLLSVYYFFMANRIFSGLTSSYELTSLALWLPFSYVVCFVFFSPRVALRTSLGIFALIALPLGVLLGIETEVIARETAIAVLMSQPIYIAALWGVGLLKAHVSGVHDLAKSMREAATVDSLTGIANRRAMLHALETVTRGPMITERPLALLLLDVDRFKGINDTYGHAVGDEVLITLTNQANAHLRSSNLLARWGGEEFIILALDQTGPQALQMAERLRAVLENTTFPHQQTVTVSIGVTSYIPYESVDVFIKRADDALYLAKETGRNRAEGVFENRDQRKTATISGDVKVS